MVKRYNSISQARNSADNDPPQQGGKSKTKKGFRMKKNFSKEAYFRNVGLAKFMSSMSLTVLLGFSPEIFNTVNANHHIAFMLLTNLSLLVFIINTALKGKNAGAVKMMQTVGLAITFIVDAAGCLFHIDMLIIIAGQSFFLAVSTPTHVLRSATENYVKDEIDLTLLHVHVANMASFGQVFGIIISVVATPYMDVYTGLLITTFTFKLAFVFERITNLSILNDRIICIKRK